MACFKQFGTVPEIRDELIRFTINGKTLVEADFNICVGKDPVNRF